MNIYDQYDARIACIMSKIEKLRGRKKRFGQGIFEPVWEPPLTEEEVAAFEAQKGIRLPDDYRRFITAYASAGKQPFGELYPLCQTEGVAEKPLVEKSFPYTLNSILYFLYMTEEEMDYFWDEGTPFIANQGLVTLCLEGDGL